MNLKCQNYPSNNSYPDNNAMRNDFFKYFKGERETRQSFTSYKTSSKGSNIGMYSCATSCCSHPAIGSLKSSDGAMYNICGHGNIYEYITILTDINGYDKGPNKVGIDLHFFKVKYGENKIYLRLDGRNSAEKYCSTYVHAINSRNSAFNEDGNDCTYWATMDKKYFYKIDL